MPTINYCMALKGFNDERGKAMDNDMDLELCATPTRLLGIERETWEAMQAELENEPPCCCEDCRRMPW